MPLQTTTVAILSYLRQNPSIRDQIRAGPGKTLLYAGSFMKPMWKEIEDLKAPVSPGRGQTDAPRCPQSHPGTREALCQP